MSIQATITTPSGFTVQKNETEVQFLNRCNESKQVQEKEPNGGKRASYCKELWDKQAKLTIDRQKQNKADGASIGSEENPFENMFLVVE